MSHVLSQPSAARAGRRAPGALVPVCGWCGKVRDQAGAWVSGEQRFLEEAGKVLTHGVCPDCIRKHFPRCQTTA
ncbi:MAG TPA: hypothetical protein VGK03_00425 [Geothrix sp.]|jgi:hypothetical protein